MTVAVCFKCGAFKWGAFNPCEKCGAKPVDPDQLAVSMAMSDHHFDKPDLERFGAAIQAGRPAPIDPDLVRGIRDTLFSPQADWMRDIMRISSGNTASRPQAPPLDNTQRIAQRLLSIEATSPGTVRMHANPFMVSAAVEALKQLGIPKPFFTSGQQFLYDSVLKHDFAMTRILPVSMLAGPADAEGIIQCWAGSGPYIGGQGLFQLVDFTSGGKERLVLSIDIKPFFGMIVDLLGEPLRD